MTSLLLPLEPPLRSLLTPITNSLPPSIHSLLITLLGAPCHNALILSIRPFSSPECLSLALSKSLGLAIILVSSIVKVPQIVKILQARSGKGVSFSANAIEALVFVVMLAYSARSGFPFSTYGETALIAGQDVVISGLVLWFGGQGGAGVVGAWVVGVGSLAVGLMSGGVVGMDALRRLQVGAGMVGLVGKMPQIWQIWREGGTGVLSAFAVFNFLLGSLARVFTTWKEVDDPQVLYSYLAGFVLNLVLAAQMVYYWNSPATAPHAEEVRGEKPKRVAMGMGASSGVQQQQQQQQGQGKGKGPSTRRRG